MAGILDSLFSPSVYGGQNVGLLDFLNSSLMQQGTYQPSTGFPAPQPPASFADRFNALPNALQPFQPSGRSFDTAAFDPQSYAPNQAQPIAVGGYQMPRMGAADLYNPAQVNLPANAQPTQGQIPQPPAPPQAQSEQGLPPALGGNALGGNLGAGFQNFVNAGGPLQAIAGGITGLLTGQRTDPLGMQQQNLAAQFDATKRALLANGVPESQAHSTALLSVLNPEAAKTVLPELLTNKQEFKVIKDALGGEHGYWIDKINQTAKPMEEGSGNGSGNSLTTGAPSVLAQGVQSYNPNLTGEDYLNQFSPEVKAAVKSYMNGDVMPTGNPRQQGIANFAKTVAQKYGQDIGAPVSDATYAAKRKMQTDIASSANNSMGGILSNGKSAFEHLKTYSDRLVDVGNVNHDFPGGGIAANIQNRVGNALGSSEQRGKISGANEAGLKYGQESTKFYAGSGGGEAERMAALKANNAESASGQEMAGFLQTEKDLMLGRLSEKEKQIREVMGEQWLQDHPVVTPDLQKTIKQIDENIAKLRGQAPATSQSSGLPSGWTVKVR